LPATSHVTPNPPSAVGTPRARRRATGGRPPSRRDATAPPLLRRPLARASVETISWSALPCWWSRERWLVHVAAVYRRGYLLTRTDLVATTGGGVSLAAVLAVAGAHAQAADYRTGRSSRPLLGVSGGATGLTATAGLGRRTVTRARTWLRHVGLATEVAAGRHRSFTERLASWERGDVRRGWTAEYALHPSMRFPDPVDNSGRIVAGHMGRGTPPRSGVLPTERSVGNVVTSTSNRSTTPAARDEDVAARRASTKTADGDGPGSPATGLMLAWRASGHCPVWARRFGAHRWAGALTAAAEAGWTARDLTQLLVDLTATGHQVVREPRRPISYLCHLLGLIDVAERPTALIDAQAADEASHRRKRLAEQVAQRDVHAAARDAGMQALTGSGRAAALAQAAEAAARVRRRPRPW
jgi:hypothetical protein